MVLGKINSYIFKYLITLFIFDAILLTLLEAVFTHYFAFTPYYRLLIILFTFLFFFPLFFFQTHKINLRPVKNEDYIVVLWGLFTVVELFYGIINGNPKVYIIGDFVYVIFGCSIYFFLSNKILTNKQTLRDLIVFSKWLLLLFIFFFILDISISENYFFLLLGLTYIFLLKKKYLFAILTLIPFLIQIKNSNRALLICFITVVIFYFLYKVSLKLKKNDRIVITSFILFILVFFYEELIALTFYLIPENTNLYYRLRQLMEIFSNGLNFNDPRHTSIVQRIIEAKVVVSLWLNNFQSFIFGCGLGGVIDGKLFIDASVTKTALLGSKSIHNIHLLPFALIHKYGLLGLIVFIMLIIDVINSFKNIIKKESNLIFVFWNIVFVLIFVYSLPAASFLWASPLFWISLSMKRKLIYKDNLN